MAGTVHLSEQECTECGSRDNRVVYFHEEDNSYSDFCFGCQTSNQRLDEEGVKKAKIKSTKKETDVEEYKGMSIEDVLSLPSVGLRDRGIVSNVAKFYGLRVAKKDASGDVTHHYYPFTKDGKVIGFQERVVSTKSFKAIGNGKTGEMELQGQHLWANGGGKSKHSTLVITEGFLDALSASQMLFGTDENAKRYPVVSLPNGAASAVKVIAANMEWVSSFKKVILMLDQDEAGVTAAEQVAKILQPGKAHIAKFSLKDASDMMMGKLEDEFKSAYWNAPSFSPSDIVTALDVRNILSVEKEVPSIPFPDFAPELNLMEYGKRKGEITLLAAGTGLGKSSFLREDYIHMMEVQDEKIGIVSLEESTRDTLMGLQSLYLNKRVHLPDTVVTDEEREKSLDWLESFGEKLVLLDHQGSTTDDDLIDKIQYMIAIGCKYIYIDHITLATSSSDNVNKAIDSFMSELLSMAKRHQVHFTVVSHLRKVGGETLSYEQGAIPTEDSLKGSGSLKQIAFTIIVLARNKMSKTEEGRSVTKVYVLKSRYTGRTGFAGAYKFDNDSGRLRHFEIGQDDDVETEELPIAPKRRNKVDTSKVAKLIAENNEDDVFGSSKEVQSLF